MDEAVRSRIVQEAAALFNAKGYRSVTLSELAGRLGMSKKTLYLYFSSKEDIAGAVLDVTMGAISAKVAGVTEREGNPLQVLAETFRGIKDEIVKLNPLFLEDIQRYAPQLWERMESFRSKKLVFIETLLTKAQQAGIIREINSKLASIMILESIQRYARPDFAAKHGVALVDVADTIFALFIEGLLKDNQS